MPVAMITGHLNNEHVKVYSSDKFVIQMFIIQIHTVIRSVLHFEK